MKILAFVDLHGNEPALNKIVTRAKKDDIELVVCAGDFTIFGQEQNIILSRLNKIGKPVLIVHGNHEDDEEVMKGCKKFKNCEYIHGKVWRHEKADCVFIGWGGGGFSFTDKIFEKKSKIFKKKIKKDEKIVLVTHAPPYGSKIDKIGGEHAGNKSFRRFIDQVKPMAAICGHLHECTGKDIVNKKTVIINPGYKGKIMII